MEQENSNRSKRIQGNRNEIQNPDNNSISDQQANPNNVCKKEKSLEKRNNNIQRIGRVQSRKTGHKRQIINEAQSSDKDVQIVEDQSNLPNERIRNKNHKINHNKKCSGCLKKIVNKNIVECGSCPKSFHSGCLPTRNSKKTQPFLCENCQEVMKEKKLEKPHKVKTNSHEHTQFQKIIKSDEVIEPKTLMIKDTSPSIKKERNQFYDKYPLYIKNRKIQFPVQDTLFDEFPLLFKKDTNFARPSPTQKFTPSFGTVLEAWNIIQTFDKNFQEHSCFTVWELYKLLYSKDNFIIIWRLYIKLAEYLLRDIFTEKFKVNKVVSESPFFSLMKYCKEIDMLDRIYKYVWIQFLNQISKLPDFMIMFKSDQFKELIKKPRGKIGQQMQPWKFQDKILMLQTILDEITESKSYYDDLQSKMERIKQNTKFKQQTFQNIKEMNSNLKQLKNLEQKNKEVLNTLNNQQHQEQEVQFKINIQIKKIKKEQKQILDQQKDLQKNKLKEEKIAKQQLPPDENEACTNVELLGRDKQQRNYLYVSQQRDKIFVNSVQDDWFVYDSVKIDQLIKSLNPKGIREKHLIEKLSEYNKNNCLTPLDKTNKSKDPQQTLLQKKIEQNKANYLAFRKKDFGQELISLDFTKKILLLGEQKMTVYLDKKGQQWGSPQDREIFIKKVQSITTNKELIDTAQYLNKRVSVVQIKSNITGQKNKQSAYQKKLKKVQTKLWGIDQKYKDVWNKYLEVCQENQLIEAFFLNFILYLTIDKYVSKPSGDSKKEKKKIDKDVPSAQSNQILNKQKPNKTNSKSKSKSKQTCVVCKQQGELLSCHLCLKLFHLNCTQLRKVLKNSYLCKRCELKKLTRSATKKIQQNTRK